MQLVLKLISSVSIKRKKPWPKLSWIGQEQEGLYILDGKRISQLYIPSGKTKRKISKLHGLTNDICALNVSQNGQFLCGALYDGKIFLWEKDKDKVQFITGLPKIFNDADKGNAKNRIFFSSCGSMILLMMGFEKLFLWQKIENHDSVDDSHNIPGTWSQVHHGEYCLPGQSNKEATVDGVFYSDEVIGRCGSFSYVFNKGTELAITSLIVKSHDKMRMLNRTHSIPNQDDETTSREVVENVRYSIKWKSFARPLYSITPATRLVKGSFVYVCRYSPDGQMLAIVLNQKLAKNTRLLFCSTLHSTSSIVDMKCCGGSDLSSGRTWWVSDISWTPDSLLLIGITRNGALFITSKLGEPINLITTGNSMDLGPSLFITLHPRITIKSFQENIPPENSEISSGSEKDVFHQKFSVAVHPFQPFLLCSDGYMVTIFDFNAKPDYSRLIADLTEDVSRLLSSDTASYKLENTSENLEKNVCSMSTVSMFMSKFGKDVSELSSPGSTLSETAKDYGIARNVEAGVITFGGIEANENKSFEVVEMTDHQKMIKAEGVLLQGLGIGASCGRHWSQDMPVAMNLLIHTWAKLFGILLDDESNCGLSNKDALFHNIITFVQSCLEAFRWDIAYQHCLPWFTQFVHSTIKCLVSSKNFGFGEIIDICMKLLCMAEEFLHEIYAWLPLSNCTTAHFLGDSFSPSYETTVLLMLRNVTINSGDGDITRNTTLDCKLDQSWSTLYHYVCKIYKSNCKTKGGENLIPDEKLVHILCWIQKKLQAINSSKNLFSANKVESLSDKGYKMYLDGKYSQAVDLLEKSFYESSKEIRSRETKDFITSHPLDLDLHGTSSSGRSLVSRSDRFLIKDDHSSKLSADIETLLSILYINLENYDLKAALALIYSFIDTTRGINLQDLLDPETRHERSQALVQADDSEVKVTSSSSLNVIQLSVLVKYPLAWVVDNCAIPIVQQLARFMACYFTNLPLTVPTPFHSQKLVTFLSDNIPKARSSATTAKNLSQQRLTEAIRQQKLESLWTADHTMELLLISGLLGEAAWFANRLGEWKIAFLLSVTEVFKKTNQSYVEKKSHGYSTLAIEVPQPEELAKERIKMILKLDGSTTETDVEETREMFDDEHISSLKNVLEASVTTELNLVPVIIKQLVEMLKENVSKLDWIVAQDLYLPAPPLYCPQPARNDGDVLNEETRKEIFLTTEIAVIVQKILAIYKASNCFLFCAQEYCKHLVPNFSDSHALPNIINEFITTEGVQIDTCEDEDLHSVIRSFQEFCGLMWLLDVRNRLALSSRKYRKLKQNLSLVSGEDRSQDVINQCKEVLGWLKRLMPFSEFLDASDDVLDSVLTLLSDLPMNCETVDLLAQYFHTHSPAISLPTADKLNRMTRKLRNNAEHIGVENGESLAVRFQQQCEERRMEANKISAQPPKTTFLELTPTSCTSLDYEHEFAFLRFLDTFLLITLAKNITSEDYKKVPLILPFKDKPTLEAEVSSIQATTRGKGKHSKKPSSGIQRSQSFQDVGSIKKKLESSLLSPDDLDSNKHTAVNRWNSLTDLRRIQSCNLSEELQAFLPTLLWLKRWCVTEEYQKGNQGANKSFSFFNMNTTPTAIRVRLPLKLVVNTLWLIENYYKDFAEAKGRCLRDKRSRVRKKKKSRAMIRENEKVGEAEESVLQEESQNLERVRRIRRPRVTPRTGQAAEESEKEMKMLEESERSTMKKEVVKEIDEMELNSKEIRLAMKRELPELKLKTRKREGNEVNPSHIVDQKGDEFGLQKNNENGERVPQTLDVGQTNEIERSVKKPFKYLNQYDQVVDKDSQDSGITGTVLNQKYEGKVSNQDFYKQDSRENISSRREIKRTLFSSPTSSSVGSKWKSLESIDGDLPLFSFTLLNDTKNTFGGKIRNASSKSSRMVSDSDFSNVAEAGMIDTYPRRIDDDDMSQTSESLSIGQIRSDVAVQMKVTANVVSDTTVENRTNGKVIKHRKAAKRKIYDESSSCESTGKPRVKPKDEGSLLRRIIRSEMRKFIQAQQAEFRSQSSTMRTTDENISDEIFKDEIHKVKGGKSRVMRKSSRKSSMSSGNDRGKTNEDFMYSSSQPPIRDNQRQPAPAQRRPMRDHGTSYEPPAVEDDTSSSDHCTRLHVAATAAKHNTVQTTHQGFPPFINERQFPIVSGWPMWYNTSFSSPAPWPWQNCAPKVNSDKGTQVDDSRKDEITGDDPKVIKKSRSVDSQLANNEDEVPNDIRDKIVSVAVQTDILKEKVETSLEGDLDDKQSTLKKDAPFLLSLNDHLDVRNKNQAGEKEVNITENKLSKTEPASTCSSSSYLEELPRLNDVFPQSLSTENPQNIKNRKITNAPTSVDEFTIPLLKFSNEVHSRAPQSLPFKIAWPEHSEVGSSERVELPLLHLHNNSEQEKDAKHLCIPEPPPNTNNQHFENAPLLHFSHQNDRDKILSDFCFVQVPENENFEFPLLYFPETGVNPPNVLSEQTYAEDAKNSEPEGKRMQSGISDNNFVGKVGETSKARIKRRNQLADTVKPSSNQVSSESPSSELEVHGRHIPTVQPAEKFTPRHDTRKKTKPRRDKLRELNSIIRDLQRDVTNDDDLVVSEVSTILSPEIRYENFEAKPEVKKQHKVPHESNNTRKLPSTLIDIGEGRSIDHNTSVDQKSSTVSHLHKPSTVSARDIHTEIPSDVPEQSVSVDAKVGTVNILRFPASVQTDTVVSRPDTINDLPHSPRHSETRELSIQTEAELTKAAVSSNMRDVAINTENILEERKDESNLGISMYPRVPTDVYLDIQDISKKPLETTLPSTGENTAVNSEQRNEPRMFLSVVDIAGDDARKQQQDDDVRAKPSKDDDYLQNEDISIEKDLDNKNDSPDVSIPKTATGILKDDIEKNDRTTVAVFTPMDSQRSSINQPTSRGTGNSSQHAQKISKEKLALQLLEMNEQFDAIEQLTSNMEQDLQRSNRLLRTIENISKVTEHVSTPKIDKQEKAVAQRVGETVERPIRNVTVNTGRIRKLSDDMNIQHDELNEERMPQRRNTHYDILQEDKRPILKSRPWVNKPIEQLTDFVLDDGAEERSLDDSLEKSQEKKETKSGDEDASVQDRPDAMSDSTGDVGNSDDIGDLQGDKDTGGVPSRASSISNVATNTVKSRVDPEKLGNPGTVGSNRSFKLSLSPEDVLNVSREKLKEILAGTTSAAVNSRNRDKTPQKQQELREWMTKKRKLRHKEWTQKLDENRQREFKPFQNQIQGGQTSISSKKLKMSEKERRDNRRAQTKEHVDERLLSAYDLMNEMVTDHAPKGPTLITQDSIVNAQRKRTEKTARVKANNRYKANRAISSKTSKKKSTGNTGLKPSSEMYRTRTIPEQIGLSGLGSVVDNELGFKHSRDALVYEYDIKESGKQFITRKSYESYQQKMSASLDFDRSLSLRRDSRLVSQLYLDPRVDELLEDVSLGDPLELQRLDNLDSLLSGDSELRDLLDDVIADKPSHGFLETKDDVTSMNSRISQDKFPRKVGAKWSPVVSTGKMLNTFNVDSEGNNWVKRQDSYERSPEDVVSANEDGNLEMSDEVAALLAEAKAAVGDDFSGTSEVGDIDWNEVDHVLQEQT